MGFEWSLLPHPWKILALAYLKKVYWKLGTQVGVSVRGKVVPATVVKTPFYRGSVKSKG